MKGCKKAAVNRGLFGRYMYIHILGLCLLRTMRPARNHVTATGHTRPAAAFQTRGTAAAKSSLTAAITRTDAATRRQRL